MASRALPAFLLSLFIFHTALAQPQAAQDTATPRSEVYNSLIETAAGLNASAPVRVDEVTEMVRVEVLRPLTVRYVYRTSWELQGAELRQHVDTDLRLAITANNCADAAVRWAIDQDVTMRHDYPRSRDGVYRDRES